MTRLVFLLLVFMNVIFVRSQPSVLNPIPDQSINGPQQTYSFAIPDDTFYSSVGSIFLSLSSSPKWLNDVSDIITKKNEFSMGGLPLSMECVGDYCYISASTSGFKILDIKNRTGPVVVGNCGTFNARNSVIEGKYAYLADYQQGFKIIDVETPSNPVIVGSYDVGGSYEGVAKKGSYSYLTDNSNGLQIFDVTFPNDPVFLSTLDTSNAFYVLIEGDYLYLCDRNVGLKIFDVSSGKEQSPVLLGSLMTIYARYIHLIDNMAYVGGDDSLEIVNITDKTDPVLVGSLDLGIIVQDFFVDEYGIAFICNGDLGFKVVDVRNPANPVLIDTYETTSHCYSVFAEKNYAIVGESLRFSIFSYGNNLVLSGTPSGSGVYIIEIESVDSSGLTCSHSFKLFVECESGYLLKDRCVLDCSSESGWFNDESSGNLRCSECIMNCTSCSTSSDCQQCEHGFDLHQISTGVNDCVIGDNQGGSQSGNQLVTVLLSTLIPSFFVFVVIVVFLIVVIVVLIAFIFILKRKLRNNDVELLSNEQGKEEIHDEKTV